MTRGIQTFQLQTESEKSYLFPIPSFIYFPHFHKSFTCSEGVLLLSVAHIIKDSCRSESDEDINRDYHGFYEFTFRRFFDDGHPGTILNFDTNFSNSSGVVYKLTSQPFYLWFLSNFRFSSSSLLSISFSFSVQQRGPVEQQ